MYNLLIAILIVTSLGMFWVTNQHIDDSTDLILKKLKDLKDKTK
jgi:uncharacterized protein (DUF2164 family)